MRKLSFIALATCLLLACKQKDTGVVEPIKMAQILRDYTKGEIYVKEFLNKDSSVNLMAEAARQQDAVFAKHKISRQAFDKSLKYYSLHPDEFKFVLDTLSGQINAEFKKDSSKSGIPPKIKKTKPKLQNLEIDEQSGK